MGEFDLERAFTRPGVLCENIEDQPGAVHDLNAFVEDLAEFTLVPRGQLIIEDNDIRFTIADLSCDLFGLAAADKGRRVRTLQILRGVPHDLETRRTRQPVDQGLGHRPIRGSITPRIREDLPLDPHQIDLLKRGYHFLHRCTLTHVHSLLGGNQITARKAIEQDEAHR